MTTTLQQPPPGAPPAGQGPARPGPAGQRQPTASPRRPAPASTDRLWLGPTLIAALSVLAGATSLSATITGSDWVVPLIEAVGVIWLLGVGCRLLRAAAPITVLVQFAGLLIALTGLFTTSGWGGFIPNAAAVRESGDLLSGAWKQILGTVPPAPATIELSFLICLTVGTTALIVDFLVAEARSPALVALPLLCLYSVPASIATELLPWWTFALPAALYAVLLAMTGHTGARARGRTNLRVVVTSVVIAAVATAAAVLIGDSVTGIGTEGRLPRSAAGGAGQIGLSPFTSLRGDLQRTDPQDLLRVSGLPHPDYLRTVGLEKWTPGDRGGFSAPELADDSTADGTLPGVDPGGADPVSIRIRSIQLADKFLPIYAHTVAVSGLAAGWQFDQQLGSVHRADQLNPKTYSLRAAFPVPSGADLRADSVSPNAALTATDGVPDSVKRTAEDITSNASTPFDKADALLNYFTDPTNGFTYSLRVPKGTTGDPLSDFLEMKQGYCEQYATTMAMMLRALGIPARVAIGFTQGTEQSDGSYLITTNDAHAWVEVKFDSHGWVRFDPTPLGGGLGHEQGFDDSAGGGANPTTTVPTTTTVESPTTGAGGNAQEADTARGQAQAADTEGGASAADEVPTPSGMPAGLWWTLLALILIGLLLAIPTAIRRLRRRRRLASAATGGAGAADAAWAEVEDLIVDHGLPLHPTESTRATANRLARTSRLTENARQRLRGLVIAAEQEWYGDRPGHSSADGKDLVAAVTALEESLERSAPRSTVDKLVPRSIRPSSRD